MIMPTVLRIMVGVMLAWDVLWTELRKCIPERGDLP